MSEQSSKAAHTDRISEWCAPKAAFAGSNAVAGMSQGKLTRINDARMKPWQTYALAIVATVATLGLRLALDGPLGGRPTLVMFTMPIVLCAYVGGLRAGLLATALSYFLASYYLLPPIHSFQVASSVERWQQFFVVLAGVVISASNEALHRARRRADTATLLRERADEQTEATRARLAAIVDSSDDAIIGKSLNGIITSWNPGAEKIFGYSALEAVGQPMQMLIPPGETNEELEILARIARGEYVNHLETARVRKGGRRILISATISPVTDGAGRIVGASKIARDITDERRAETALREKEAQLHAADSRLAAIVQGMNEACIALDREWRFTFVNDRGESLFAHRRDQMLGQSIWEVFPKLVGTPMEANYRRAMGQRAHVSFEAFSPIANRWLDIRLFPSGDGLAAFYLDIQERKQAEVALHASKATLEAALASMTDAVFISDLQGRFIEFNEAFATVHRFKNKDQCVKAFADYPAILDVFTPAGDLVPVEQWAVPRALRGETRANVEYSLRRKDTGESWIGSYSFAPIRDKDGAVVGTVVVGRDITERKQVELALRESETSLAAAQTRAKIGNWEVQAATRAIKWSAEMFRIFGRAPELGPPRFAELEQMIHSADREQFGRKYAAAGARQGVYEQEFRVVRPDGDIRWIEGRGEAVLDDAGRVLRMIGTAQDITERKGAEAKLQESEERFRTMANSMSQLAWIARTDGFIVWYNQRWFDYTGTTPQQMEGWGWQIVHDPQVLPRVMAEWTGAIAAGNSFEMEFPLRGADGLFRRFLTRAIPLKNAQGQVLQWFGTNTDVDELKRADDAIRDLNANLEQRVIERTGQLEAANKELEAFSYSVSHDLRAPLRGVHGYVRMLMEDYAHCLDANGNRLLGVVGSEAKRMGQLIDDLLAFSRMGRQKMASTINDMTSMAREEFENLTRAAPESAPRLDLRPLPSACGDPAMLRQVFANLLGNAIKFSGKQTNPIVEVGSHGDGDTITFYVKDNGVGFDEQYRHKLFGVFQRLHGEEEFEGTGVGLALVQRVIQRHGGKVWAEGKPGEGATFHFTLPMQ